MLGKLMKYEWKATWKLMVAANLLTVVMTVIAYFMMELRISSDNGMMEFMAMMMVATYLGSIFAVSVGTSIYLIYRFYTSTYSDQGYLLHTLPVDTHHIIVAKMLVSAMWLLISIVFIYLSVIFLILKAWDGTMPTLKSFLRNMESTLEMLGADRITAFTVIMTLVAFVFSLFARVLKVSACISLGQLSANHKLLMSFAWYIGIYIVEQFINGIYFAVLLVFEKRLRDGGNLYPRISYFDSQWETTLIAGILSCVVYYLLTWYMMSRKLNLE